MVAQLGIGPRFSAKDHARVGNVEAEGGQHDHSGCQGQSEVSGSSHDKGVWDVRRLENHEQRLVADKGPIIALLQLVDAVDAANEDQDGGKEQETEEQLHPRPQRASGRLPDVAYHVFDEHADKEDEGGDLEDQTGDGDPLAGLVAAASLRGRESAAGGLEDERHNVAGNEEPDEELGVESRHRAVEMVDAEWVDGSVSEKVNKDLEAGGGGLHSRPCQQHIDGRAEKHRRRGDANYRVMLVNLPSTANGKVYLGVALPIWMRNPLKEKGFECSRMRPT